SMVVADPDAKHWEIVGPDGMVVKVLPLAWPDVYPTPTDDGRLLAYAKDKLLHIYDVSSGTDKTIDAGIDLADAQLVWSPDERQIAVALSKTSFDPLFVGVADIAAGMMTKREYSPLGGVSNVPQGADATIVGWLNDSQFEYRVVSSVETDPFNSLVSQGGTLDLDSATSGQIVSELDTAGPWSWCAGGCAPLPPAGFENTDGLVSWCSVAMPSCRPVLGVVDRSAGKVRRLLDAGTTAIIEDFAMSPDAKTLAVTLRDKTNHQRLRLVNVQSGASHDYPLPYVNEGHGIRWSPDGKTILLYFPGT
ncbi:MAG TPA: hypothetical protein VFY79_11790, partial [Dehalococcoidia bacterium]|nr:hypothetical protein [Dehalococcoidia bacterium]